MPGALPRAAPPSHPVRPGGLAVHGLRAYDAVQLATAQAVREAAPGCAAFAAFDKNLRGAAAMEGFALVPA